MSRNERSALRGQQECLRVLERKRKSKGFLTGKYEKFTAVQAGCQHHSNNIQYQFQSFKQQNTQGNV